MSIKVRYFASLREQLGCAEQQLDGLVSVTIADVWRYANPELPLPDNLLSAVNQEYAPMQQLVHDGDEVAFFPPVTGG